MAAGAEALDYARRETRAMGELRTVPIDKQHREAVGAYNARIVRMA